MVGKPLTSVGGFLFLWYNRYNPIGKIHYRHCAGRWQLLLGFTFFRYSGIMYTLPKQTTLKEEFKLVFIQTIR
nr:MAG TPA: hypothetical protein [Caudoviricetes sp.]